MNVNEQDARDKHPAGKPETVAKTEPELKEVIDTRDQKNLTDPRKEFLRAVAEKVLDKPDLGREDSYRIIAELWSTYMKHRLGGHVELEPHDVAALMVLFKVARLTHDPDHPDSWLDIAGYAVGGHEKAQDSNIF